MSKYKELKNRILELEQDLKIETLKNQKLNSAFKNSTEHCVLLSERCDQLVNLKNMLIQENSSLKNFNESKTEAISDLISQNIEKDKEISSLRFMINEMKGW